MNKYLFILFFEMKIIRTCKKYQYVEMNHFEDEEVLPCNLYNNLALYLAWKLNCEKLK